MKRILMLVSGALCLLILASCAQQQADVPTELANQAYRGRIDYWRKSQVDAVLDLSELGKITVKSAGTYALKGTEICRPGLRGGEICSPKYIHPKQPIHLIGGKYLNPKYITNQAYGRDYNLLNLSGATLNKLNPSVRKKLVRATPSQIKSYLKRHKIPLSTLRSYQKGKIVRWEAESLAKRVARSSKDPNLLRKLGLSDERAY